MSPTPEPDENRRGFAANFGAALYARRGVLTSLAMQARQQADRRRLVEAERAPVQREVVVLTVVMGSLLVGLFVFARSEYLEPYGTASGQLFLGIVLAIYLVLLARVQRLARYPRPHRFLVTDQVAR